MSILNEKMSRFKALITVGSVSYNSSYEGLLGSVSALRGDFESRTTSFSLGSDFLMSAETGLFKKSNTIAKSSGLFNLAQALTHRLMTTRGTMPGYPNFGVPWDNYIGSTYKDKLVVSANLEFDIRDEISKDNRVSRIESLTISFLNSNTVSVDLTVLPVTSSSAPSLSSISINISGGV